MALTAVFLALWALAAFYGRIGIEGIASLLFSVCYVQYRVIQSWNQLKLVDQLLPMLYVGPAIYVVCVGLTRHIVPCGWPFTAAMLLWAVLIARGRIYIPELDGLGAKIRDRIRHFHEFEDHSHNNRPP